MVDDIISNVDPILARMQVGWPINGSLEGSRNTEVRVVSAELGGNDSSPGLDAMKKKGNATLNTEVRDAPNITRRGLF